MAHPSRRAGMKEGAIVLAEAPRYKIIIGSDGRSTPADALAEQQKRQAWYETPGGHRKKIEIAASAMTGFSAED